MTNAKLSLITHASDRDALIEDFRSFVAAPSFPCVGAKSALHRERRAIALGSLDVRIPGGKGLQ